MARTQVQSELIATNAISGTIIADGAITSTHLAANCVDSSELVTGSIDTIHIAANQVTSAKIVSDAVLTRHIADNQVTGDQLANGISMTNATTIVTDGAVSTLTLHRDGSNIGTASNIGSIQFAQDYDASQQNWGAISLKTTASAVRTRLAFDVKTTSGLVQEGMTIFGSDSNGAMVGIGNTSPSQLLHIQKASVDNYIRVGPNATGNDAGIYFATNSDWCVGIDNSNSNAFSIASGSTVGTNPRLTINTSGDVGIGTTSPSFSAGTGLEISRAGPATLRLEDTDGTTGATELVQVDADGYLLTRQASSALIFGINSSEKMRLASNGYLGIGTSSPSANLHLYDTAGDKPHLLLENYGNRGTGDAPILEFYLNDETTGGINDDTQVGVITFAGDEKDSNSKETYGQIRGIANDPGSGSSNKGAIDFMIQKDGTLTQTMALVNGKVGIGTGSPDTHVHISTSDRNIIKFHSSYGTERTYYFRNDSGVLNIGEGTPSDANDLLNLDVANDRVGIGTKTPARSLHVNSADANVASFEGHQGEGLVISSGTDGRIDLIGYDDGATSYNHLIARTGSSDQLYLHTSGLIGVGGTPNTGLSNSSASIQILAPTTATADYTAGNFNAGSLLSLDANNGESHYAGIRFTHNGNTEGFFGFVRTTATTDISDFVWQGYDGNNNTYKEYFRIAANGDLTAIDTSIASNSDKRLKENIEDFTGGLELISKLKPRTFTWKEPKQRKEGIIRGFVAQEVLEVDDYWIDEIEVKEKEHLEYKYTKDTEKAYTSKLSDKDAMYISAIQELEARIKKLEG